jgi:hypothetical protein
MRQRRADAGKHRVDMATDQIVHRRSRSLVGNVDDVDAGDHLQQLAAKVRR